MIFQERKLIFLNYVEIRLWLGIISFTYCYVRSYSIGEELDYDLSKPLKLLEIPLKKNQVSLQHTGK